MKKLFEKNSGEEHNFWMSYTDLMSGFLIVFIVASIIAMGYMIDYTPEFKEFEGVKGDVRVVVDEDKRSIILYHKNASDDLFPTGGYDPQLALKDFLDIYGRRIVKKAIELKKSYSDVELRIEGHTDPAGIRDRRTGYVPPYGSEESFIGNMTLSSQRANAVYSYLYNNCGLNPSEKEFLRNSAISVGCSFSERIKAGTHSDRYRDQELDDASRRIEIKIISR